MQERMTEKMGQAAEAVRQGNLHLNRKQRRAAEANAR